MAQFKNKTSGPKGVYVGNRLVMVEAGQSVEADKANEEWFSKVGSQEAKPAPKADKKKS